MKSPQHDPRELADADKTHKGRRESQPYGSELDDRALERAQREKTPVPPAKPSGGKGAEKTRP